MQAFPPLRLNAVKKVVGEETSVTESYIQGSLVNENSVQPLTPFDILF